MRYDGEIRTFKPGNLLEVQINAMRTRTYDLGDKDTIYALDAGLRQGSRVRIRETHDAAGRKVVEVRAGD